MLAIIIPYYKKTFFKECLDSLSRQTNKNFTVYIGDDASPEDPLDLIEESKDQIDITYKRFKNNLGGISLSKQWERCIELTRDEKWLMILGDDDYLSNNYVEEFYKHLAEIEEKDIKVVRFASRIIRSPSGDISKKYTHPKIEKSTDSFFRKFLKFSRGSLTEQVFSRDAYSKHGFREFPLGWGSDNFAWLDFTEFGFVYAINSATAYFRISDENISRGDFLEELKLETKQYYFSLIINRYLNKFRKEQRVPLLLFYEQIIYNSKKANFSFWLKLNSKFINENAYLQVLKFTRRYLIFHLK